MHVNLLLQSYLFVNLHPFVDRISIPDPREPVGMKKVEVGGARGVV